MKETPKNNFTPIRPYPDLVSDIVNLRGGKLPGSGALIIGEKGQLFSQDDYGRSFYVKLKGEKEFTQGDKHEACQGVPQTIDRSPGHHCLLYTSPSPRDVSTSRMPSSA